MIFFDQVKSFFRNLNKKRLPEGNALDEGIIPIRAKGKNNKRLAEIISKEIKRYPEFYELFLEKYDVICIGDIEAEEENILRVQNEIQDSTWKYAGEFELMGYARRDLIKRILDGYSSERKGNLTELDIAQCLSYNGPERILDKDFYWFIINERQYSSYLFDLREMKDWKGLKMYLDAENDQEFAKQYMDENIYTVLGKAAELYNDPREGYFFDKNIGIISDASNYTAKYFADAMEDTFKFVAYAIENGCNTDDKDQIRSLSKQYDEQKKSSINCQKISKERIIELASEVFDYIDPTGEFRKFFESKMKEGKIVLFDKDEKDATLKELEAIFNFGDTTQKPVNDGANYKPFFDMCSIPIDNAITDVPTIIHEVTHQYHWSKKNEIHGYSEEVPSIYFEKMAIEYLMTHGYEQESDILQESFHQRMVNDSANNAQVINKYIAVTKTKHDEGVITEQSFMREAEVAWKLMQMSGMDVSDTKKKYAKRLIETFKSRDRKVNNEIVVYCSYSLGTYLAGKYSNDEQMKQRMLQLVKNPEYSLQNLIDEINAQEQNKEDKKITINDESMDR